MAVLDLSSKADWGGEGVSLELSGINWIICHLYFVPSLSGSLNSPVWEVLSVFLPIPTIKSLSYQIMNKIRD